MLDRRQAGPTVMWSDSELEVFADPGGERRIAGRCLHRGTFEPQTERVAEDRGEGAAEGRGLQIAPQVVSSNPAVQRCRSFNPAFDDVAPAWPA